MSDHATQTEKKYFFVGGGDIFSLCLFCELFKVSSPGGSESRGDRQTDKQTDIWTYRLNWPRGRFIEKRTDAIIL